MHSTGESTSAAENASRKQRPPHLFFVCSRWHPNVAGPAAYVRRTLGHLLAAFDDEISVVTEVRDGHLPPVPPELPKGVFATIRPCTCLPYGLGAEVSGALLALRAWAFGIAHAKRPILYFTGGHVGAGWRTAAILGRLLRIPVVVEAVLVGADDASSLLKARWRLLTRTAVGAATYVSVISTALASSFARELPRANVVYNPYGVDTELFRPATHDERASHRIALGLADTDLVGLFVGNVNPRKDVLSLVDAWLHTASLRPDLRWALLVVGHYDEQSEYFSAIQHRLINLTPNAVVRFLGPREDVPSIMRACDLYVSASTAEGLGLANVEAMSTGLPVVCRYLAGITDDMICGNAVTGIHVWSPAAFADSVERITELPARQAAAQDARKVAVERFTLRERIERIRSLVSTC